LFAFFETAWRLRFLKCKLVIAGKLDVYVEQSTRKVANYLGDVLEDQVCISMDLFLGGKSFQHFSIRGFWTNFRPSRPKM
jgi:hypothetical protein